jgi:polyribonucleotide nucleotidyltransferase
MVAVNMREKGALAEKSILRSIPTDEEVFPYTIRIVSDILESNGSSSMASVCGGVLSLMDAGVPLSMIIAGISIGLVHEGDRDVLLTDIAGLEDHFGDMDLKVAGTEKGITAIQMDLKVPFISIQVFKDALTKAKNARVQVLAKMNEALPKPRTDISPYAPRIINLMINPEKVGDVIGPGGKIIKKIIAQTNSKIEIEESGKITIASADTESAESAKQMIREITVEAEVGKTYTGKIVRLEEYGGFVEILPNIVGLLHISEIAQHRIRNIRDVLKMGQTVRVKVLAIDEDNKIKLSKRALEQNSNRSSGFDNNKQKKSSFHNNRNNRNKF